MKKTLVLSLGMIALTVLCNSVHAMDKNTGRAGIVDMLFTKAISRNTVRLNLLSSLRKQTEKECKPLLKTWSFLVVNTSKNSRFQEALFNQLVHCQRSFYKRTRQLCTQVK